MQCCGVLDVDGMTVSAEAKLNQALHGIYLPHQTSQHSLLPTHFPTHLYGSDDLGNRVGELVRIPHSGETFSNEYEADHIYKAFPKVFPFGIGGFMDSERSKKLGWYAQMRWMLEQSHGLFAEHEVFMFVIFNLLQAQDLLRGKIDYHKG
jgi:hypothetical protein